MCYFSFRPDFLSLCVWEGKGCNMGFQTGSNILWIYLYCTCQQSQRMSQKAHSEASWPLLAFLDISNKQCKWLKVDPAWLVATSNWLAPLMSQWWENHVHWVLTCKYTTSIGTYMQISHELIRNLMSCCTHHDLFRHFLVKEMSKGPLLQSLKSLGFLIFNSVFLNIQNSNTKELLDF